MATVLETGRAPGQPFGVLNLAKFRAEVQNRVNVAREATMSTTVGSKVDYMMSDAYDSPPPRTSGTATSGRIALEQRLLEQTGDEAYEKMQKRLLARSEPSPLSLRSPETHSKHRSGGDSPEKLESRRSRSSLEVIHAPKAFYHLKQDPVHSDRAGWVQPEKWYALTAHSAQTHAKVAATRDQTARPLLPTSPSQHPYSLPPSRINKFSDVSPNPRLIDGRRAKKNVHKEERDPKEKASPHRADPRFGMVRKCNNPFTQGWKVATFKPARDKLVPYRGTVSKYSKSGGYGTIDLDGHEVFVHQNEVIHPEGLRKGQVVLLELNSHGRRGLEGRKVRLDDGSVQIPEGMDRSEYQDLMQRRDMDDEVKVLFETGFWKYPSTEETLEEARGGQGVRFTPYEKDVSFDRLMTITNPMTDAQAKTKKAPPIKRADNGPSLAGKLERKPWLAKSLHVSPARHPLPLPSCGSYFTSAVVSFLDQPRAPAKPFDLSDAAKYARGSPTRMETTSDPHHMSGYLSS
mmetsp:Transcript_64339/g.153460  ORF Transcript_64339/g.153460 Transcript_64339/m.153460 type:complete len:517 (+) Transcript_64339:42-1592(+)